MYYIKSLIYGSNSTEKDQTNQRTDDVNDTIFSESKQQPNDIITDIQENAKNITGTCDVQPMSTYCFRQRQTGNSYCTGMRENKHFETMQGQHYVVQQSGFDNANSVKNQYYTTTMGSNYVQQQSGEETVVSLETNYYASAQ